MSDLQMAPPGPTSTLSLADHRRFEVTLSFTRATSAHSERLADFQDRRDRYWAAANLPPIHRPRHLKIQLSSGRPYSQSSGATYEVSQDGCWVMEVFANAGDMCFVTHRHIFNMWTYEQLRQCDMSPWVTLHAACRQQICEPWKPDEQPDPCTSTESGSDQFFAMTSPNLHHNIGCHDDFDEDEPRADYHCGCSRVAFHKCHVEQGHGLSSEVQVIRASRYADTFDESGRHWVYVLPSSPLQTVLSRCLKFTVPRPITQRIWELAVSWPRYVEKVSAHTAVSLPTYVDKVSAHTDIVSMKVHPDWPFNMLRIRRHDHIVERTTELTSDIVAVILQGSFPSFSVSVDEGRSSGEFWKLAPGMKAVLIDSGFLVDDYLEDTEGFITKSYYQDATSPTYVTLTT